MRVWRSAFGPLEYPRNMQVYDDDDRITRHNVLLSRNLLYIAHRQHFSRRISIYDPIVNRADIQIDRHSATTTSAAIDGGCARVEPIGIIVVTDNDLGCSRNVA